jgi:hypothetical protein
VRYFLHISGYNTNAGHYVLNVTGTPCPVAPPPVTDLVIRLDLPNHGTILNWSPSPGATSYNIYEGISSDNLFVPSNLINTTTDTTIAYNYVLDLPIQFFYGVIAVNNAALNSVPGNTDDLPKANAVQGPIVVSPGFSATKDNIELGGEWKTRAVIPQKN